MLVCLHEEHVVAIAHGYAKVTGKPLLGIVHSNVGLMHASMAIYNAWCDRMPVILLGATGPVDAAKRRPWIDWLHTARDQAALVRGFVKWDDQPASVAAAFEVADACPADRGDGAEGPGVRLPRRIDAGRKARRGAAPAGPVRDIVPPPPPTPAPELVRTRRRLACRRAAAASSSWDACRATSRSWNDACRARRER